MRDKVVGLEDETYTFVAVGIPVDVVVFFSGNTVNLNVTAGISVQSAYYIEKSRLTATGGSQYGNKLVLSEFYRKVVKSENAFLVVYSRTHHSAI